jgi:hypothetical protein
VDGRCYSPVVVDGENGRSAEEQRQLELYLADGRGRHSYMRPFTVVAIVVFATGAMLGAFVTGLWIPAPRMWWAPLAIRVTWQLGGALLLAVAIALEARPRAAPIPWRVLCYGLLVATVIGSLLCFNPLLDLARGPAIVHGRLTLTVKDAGSVRNRYATDASIVVRERGGQRFESEITGRNKAEIVADLQACDRRAPVTVTVLRHLEYVLAVSCTQGDR